MDMQSKKRMIIALSIIALVIAGFAYATASQRQRGGFHRGQRGEMFTNRMGERLGLTDDQKAKVKEILEAEKTAVKPLTDELAETRRQLREATAEGRFDEAQVSALAEKQGQALAKLIVEKERVKSSIYAVLTPEQRTKANGFLNRFEMRRHEHRGKRGEGKGNGI
jgi:protein CpxP